MMSPISEDERKITEPTSEANHFLNSLTLLIPRARAPEGHELKASPEKGVCVFVVYNALF